MVEVKQTPPRHEWEVCLPGGSGQGRGNPSRVWLSAWSHWVVRWPSLAWACSLVPFVHSSFFSQSTIIHHILLEITFSAKPFCLLQRQGLRTENILSVCILLLWPRNTGSKVHAGKRVGSLGAEESHNIHLDLHNLH